MPKESRGQKVKTFTAYIPGPGADKEPQRIQVYFSGKDNEFSTALPGHIVEGIGKHPDKPVEMRGNAVYSKLAENIEPAFIAACKLYEKIQNNALRKKVILVEVSANHPKVSQYAGRGGEGLPEFPNISFTPTPALAFNFSIYWQVNDGLYRAYKRDKDAELEEMTYVTAVPDSGKFKAQRSHSRWLIDWTEEREQFLDNIEKGLVVLIERLWILLSGDTAANVDRLIAGGGQLMLSAPKTEMGAAPSAAK